MLTRRNFLQSAGALTAFAARGAALPRQRVFEITTSIEILKPSGVTRAWLPHPLISKQPFQQSISDKPGVGAGRLLTDTEPLNSLHMVYAEFPADAKPAVSYTSRVATTEYSVDLSAPGGPRATSSDLKYFLRPTKLIPTDGIVKETANKITKGATTDLAKARAIYEWVVDNTFRNPKTRGCGIGDIRFMLESGDLGGKCADLNALYVGLARAAGLPARDVYGIRAGKSEFGYKSLGAATENITKAQHCRAEVWLSTHGWVPVDPADVRKVVLEEPPGNRPLSDEMVKAARARLFGSWEMNWIGYNFAHDVKLPNSTGSPLGYFMYPQAETAEGRLDSLDPDTFRYEITSREITPV